MFNKSTIFFVFILFAASCTDKNASNHLADISTLQAQVDSSNTVFQTIDFELIKEYKENSDQQLTFLKENFKDSSTFENAKYIDVYYGNFKLMRKMLKGQPRLEEEILYSQQQLDHLYQDVKNGMLEDSVYTKYYEGEAKAVKQIINSTFTLKDWETRSVKRYNGMVAPIDSVINELHKQGYR